MKRIYILFLMLGIALNSHAQLFEWDVNFHGFADNREYIQTGRYSQTIIGLRLTPSVGIDVDSTHRIRVGGDMLYEFGSDTFLNSVDPVAYYQYHNSKLDFYIGMFPRASVLSEISESLLNDTLSYYDPNVNGMLLHYHHHNITQKLWINWTSQQSYHKREQFLVGISGQFDRDRFFVAHQATLWHNALSNNPNVDEHIRDNVALKVFAGLKYNQVGFLDSLNASVGTLISLDRIRNVYDWRTPKGVTFQIYAAYNSLFLNNELYVGEPQAIPNGINFYNEKYYNRFEVGWAPLRGKRLEGVLKLRFHFTPQGMDNQQVFSLRYNIGDQYPI